MHSYESPSSWSETEGKEKEDHLIPENEQAYEERLGRAKKEAFQFLKKWVQEEKRPSSLEGMFGKSGEAKIGHWPKGHGLDAAFEERSLADLTYEELEEVCRKSVDDKAISESSREDIRIERQRFMKVLEFVDFVLAPLVLIHGVDGSIRQEQAEEFANMVQKGGVASTLDSVSDMAEAAQYYMPGNVLKVRRVHEDESDSLHRTENGNGPIIGVELELKLGANGRIEIIGDEDVDVSGVRVSVT